MLNPHRGGWAALLCSGKTSLACASVLPKTHGCPLQVEVSEVTGWPPEGWCHSGGPAVAWGAAFTGGASSSLPKAALLMGPGGSICVAELRAHSVNWSPCFPWWTQTHVPETPACHGHSYRSTCVPPSQGWGNVQGAFLTGEEQTNSGDSWPRTTSRGAASAPAETQGWPSSCELRGPQVSFVWVRALQRNRTVG